VSQRVTGYLDEISKQNTRTARVFRSHLGDFDRFNGGKTDEVVQLLKAAKSDVYDLLKSYSGYLLNKGTLSAKTIGYSVKTARRFLEFNDVELSNSKFHLKVRLPKAIRTEVPGLTKADVVKIINGLPDIRIKTYVMFLASSGCRAEEALSITWADIDFTKEPATVHIDGNFTKTKADRHLWLTDEMRKQLEVWLEYKYRTRTIKNKTAKGEWVKRELSPRQKASDFVFLPNGHEKPVDLKKTKNLLQAQRTLKNAYYPLYDTFKAAVKRIGSNSVTFHSFRRFVYTAIEGLGHGQFAEFYLGHTNSPYWKKPEAEKIRIFKLLEPYLTFLDIAALENRGADIQSQIEQKDLQMRSMQEQMALMMAYMTEPDPNKKAEISRRLIEKGYLPWTNQEP